jgi:hypothetical protein
MRTRMSRQAGMDLDEIANLHGSYLSAGSSEPNRAVAKNANSSSVKAAFETTIELDGAALLEPSSTPSDLSRPAATSADAASEQEATPAIARSRSHAYAASSARNAAHIAPRFAIMRTMCQVHHV